MKYPEIKVFESNPTLAGFARLEPGITYSQKNGGLKLSLITPWADAQLSGGLRPLVVFLQGSSWTFPKINKEIPQLAELAREGYVVATIEHRNAAEGHPFPAYLEDTKTAIRFLRAHAEEYGIDPTRVCMYGTSSGGNTALLVGVTGDMPEFKTDEYAGQSDAVQLVVDCFGPSNLPKMIDLDPSKATEDMAKLIYGLAGDRTPEETIERMSPVNYLKNGADYPPFLLLYGDADTVVPYSQGEEMFHRLIDCGADAHMVRVKGAGHEGDFWSRPLVEEIYNFIRQRL